MKILLFVIACVVLLLADNAYAQSHRYSGNEQIHRYGRTESSDYMSRERRRNTDTPNRSGDTYCKRYSREVNKGGRIEEEYGTVCLDNNGNWRVTK